MNKKNAPELQNEPVHTPEDHEKTRFKRFLDRLTVFHPPKLPVRTWLAWAGVIAFVVLVIAYYAINGG